GPRSRCGSGAERLRRRRVALRARHLSRLGIVRTLVGVAASSQIGAALFGSLCRILLAGCVACTVAGCAASALPPPAASPVPFSAELARSGVAGSFRARAGRVFPDSLLGQSYPDPALYLALVDASKSLVVARAANAPRRAARGRDAISLPRPSPGRFCLG